MIDARQYPQLAFLLWNRSTTMLTPEDALALYEGNRRWVDPESMDAHERAFFDRIVAEHGRGVFLG